MSQEILFDVKADAQSEYYGTLVVSNIHLDGSNSVTVKEYLGIIFKSPASVANRDFWYSTNPWVEITPDISSQQIDGTRFLVTAKLSFSSSYTFNAKETLTFGINGNLNSSPQQYGDTFILTADQIPAGTVNINCAAAPDEALVGYSQALTFIPNVRDTPVTVTPGTTTPFQFPPTTYSVTAAELTDEDQTVVATALVSPSTITVVSDYVTALDVTYGQVDKYSAIDVTIGNISPLLQEQFYVKVVSSSQTLAFWSPANHTTSLRRLPPSGTIDVSVDTITLNNVQYSFNTQSIDVEAKLYNITFPQADKVVDIDTTGFVQLPVVVTTDLTLDATITVRLVGPSPANFIYTHQVEAKAGTTTFAALVTPAQYTVQAPSLIQNFIVNVVEAPNTLVVAADSSTILQLKIVRGANLKVPGFPNFLSFGGITDMTDGNEADFVSARASSIFKYAGVDGAGDPTVYLDKDQATVRTIELAYRVGQKLGQTVLPMMISYTCDLSGGNYDNLQNSDRLAHSFANLIVSLKDANETIKTYPVPAVGYIVNPDFIGASQQKGLTPGYIMPVRKPLQDALDHWEVPAEIPANIEDTLGGYVLAVNWLMRTIALTVTFTVTFGWQLNLWGVGSSNWIYTTEDPANYAQQTATYATELEVFDSTYHPDFLAVDRYEADDFTIRAYGNGYCFGPYEWPRFFDFCRALSVILQVPVAPWQIPTSRTPLINDLVNSDFDTQHWGTGGSYILGDAGVNSDYHNVNPKILALNFAIDYMGNNAEEMFKRGEPFDWTNPAYLDFPLHGIFTVLLGGGQTTGIVSSIGNAGSFVLDKLNAYMDNPIPLDNTAFAGN